MVSILTSLGLIPGKTPLVFYCMFNQHENFCYISNEGELFQCLSTLWDYFMGGFDPTWRNRKAVGVVIQQSKWETSGSLHGKEVIQHGEEWHS
mmetsp:Transcript_14960/g.22065  ORF Transcript_14960/g.22065 Transcript_14960/m.22065 type:complete len:93 (+) Transcript_14960:93-371(+)